MLWIPHLWPNRFLQAQICLPTRILDNTISHQHHIPPADIWHTFVYPHKLQNHNAQRPFRAKQLKVWYENRIFPQFLTFNVRFVRQGSNIGKRSTFPQFLTFDVHFVRKGCDRLFKIVNLLSVFDFRRPFRAKGFKFEKQFHLSFWRSTSVSCETVAIDFSKS